MPWLVVFTIRSLSATSEWRSDHGLTWIFSLLKISAICSARSWERLVIIISLTPSWTSAYTIANPPPPAPKTSADRVVDFQSGKVEFRLSRKPSQSLLTPRRELSCLTTIQLTAPISFPTGSNSSTVAIASCLSGIVRFTPLNPSLGNDSRAGPNVPGLISIGI